MYKDLKRSAGHSYQSADGCKTIVNPLDWFPESLQTENLYGQNDILQNNLAARKIIHDVQNNCRATFRVLETSLLSANVKIHTSAV